MGNANLFAGIGNASEDDERLKYWGKKNEEGETGLDDGKYAVSLDKFAAFESKNPDYEGQATFVTEVTIDEVLEGSETSPAAGDRRSFIQRPQRKPSGALTEKGGRAMGRVKSVAAAVLNVDAKAITGEMCGTISEGDGTAMAGIKLIVTVQTTDKGWTNVYWDNAG